DANQQQADEVSDQDKAEQNTRDTPLEMSGIKGLKDTSRILESDGKFYCYATGGGLKMIWTTSLETGKWNKGEEVFPEPPKWWSSYNKNNSAWAPDIVWDQ